MKKQGYNDRLDERLGMIDGKESTKKQSYKDRRDESRGMRDHERRHNHHMRHSSHEDRDTGDFDDLREVGNIHRVSCTPDFEEDHRILHKERVR